MGFRFWRRFRIAPGVTLNVSKSGVSVSVGPQGAKFTMGPGGKRVTVGIPGSGAHYTHVFTDKKPKKVAAKAKEAAAPAGAAEVPYAMPPSEDLQAFDEVLEDLREGKEAAALLRARVLVHHPDAAFVAAILALRLGADTPKEAALAEEAAAWLASADSPGLGALFDGLGETFTLDLPVTDEVRVILMPDRRGVGLARVEALQRLGRLEDAVKVLTALKAAYPDDALVALSLEDLLDDAA